MSQSFNESLQTTSEVAASPEQAYLFQIFRSMSEKYNLSNYGMMAHPDELPQISDVELLLIIANNAGGFAESTLMTLVQDHNYRAWGTTARMEDPEYAEAFHTLEAAIQQQMEVLGMPQVEV